MLILILYSVKQTSSAVNIAQGPPEMLLQLHRICFLWGPQELKRSMFEHVENFHIFLLSTFINKSCPLLREIRIHSGL